MSGRGGKTDKKSSSVGGKYNIIFCVHTSKEILCVKILSEQQAQRIEERVQKNNELGPQ